MTHEKVANPATERATAEQIGKDIVHALGGGLGAGAGAAGLYYMLHGLRKAELPSVGPSVAGATSGARLKPKQKKSRPPSRDPQSPVNIYKAAAAPGATNKMLSDLYYTIGSKVPTSLLKMIGGFGSQPTTPNATGTQEAFKSLGQLGAAGLGGYMGISAVNSVANAGRKADVKDDVESARQEYFDALTGKTAATLDTVFNAWQKHADGPGALDKLLSQLGRTWGQYVTMPMLGTALGTGVIGGTYMYDQVKSRNKAENLRRAAAARARLAGIQKTPYIDPEELAALTNRR